MSFDILIFLFVLGVLIFVHEMGHFLVAKACNVYVDRFSLGMPPRIFGFKYGETDYCLGLLPIGGYVKMAGQEDAPLSDDERETTYGHVPPERWFNNRPRYQRALILVAGPAMNLVLGFIVYAIMAGVGGEVPLTQVDNRIGYIREDSPASKAPMYLIPDGGGATNYSDEPDLEGWQAGDRIVTINGKKVNGLLQDVVVEAILGEDNLSIAEIEREGPDGLALRYRSPVRPELVEGDPFPTFGIRPYDTTLIAKVQPGMPAAAAGLEEGDEIIAADGKPVDRELFLKKIKNLTKDTTVSLTLERGDERLELQVATLTRGRIDGIALQPSANPLLGLSADSRPAIQQSDGEFTKRTGLAGGDIVETVQSADGNPVEYRDINSMDPRTELELSIARPASLWGLLGSAKTMQISVNAGQLLEGLSGFNVAKQPVILGITEEQAEATGLQRKDVIVEIDGQPATSALLREIQETRIGDSVPIRVRRPAILFGLYQKEEMMDATLPVASVQEIGVVLGVKMIYHRAEPGEILPEAWDRSARVTAQIGSVLKLLFTGGLSPKMLGGPVMIYDITTGAARTNLVLFLDIFAMISINLAIFNLLPLPVLDGGQLFFLGIEAIRRKPVSIKVLETVQQAGLLLIIGLILYVTFNDVSRVVDRFLP